MDYPSSTHGISMGYPWMLHGLSMDCPWIILKDGECGRWNGACGMENVECNPKSE
jgi:hypothetical protein